MKRFILILLIAITTALAATAAKQPVWEVLTEVKAPDSSAAQPKDPIDVNVTDGQIYIYVREPVTVEIFSILGQRITGKSIEPGTVRLTLSQRGVYILKAGTYTRRINL